MRKLTLLSAGILTLACLGGQAITAEASSLNNAQVVRSGNHIIISYSGSICDSDSAGQLKSQIKEQLSNILSGACTTNKPGAGAPDTEIPDSGSADSGSVDTDRPEAGTPDKDASDAALSYAEQVVELVNEERAKKGLSPLSIDTSVQAAAQVRAQECEQLFSHTRPDGSGFATALSEQNVSYKTAGENIAWGQSSPEEVVNAWMNSDGHRANILSEKYTSIGVGYYQNAKGVNYWSQLFIG